MAEGKSLISDPRAAAAAPARPQLEVLGRPAAGLALVDPDVRRGQQGLRPPAEAGLWAPLDIPGAGAAALTGRAVLLSANGPGRWRLAGGHPPVSSSRNCLSMRAVAPQMRWPSKV